jgi:hypothetical protein
MTPLVEKNVGGVARYIQLKLQKIPRIKTHRRVEAI